jgi:hypothetical protein
MGYILNTGRFSDVTFYVGEDREVVKGHKLILSTRSAVFEAMFERWEYGDKVEVEVPEVSAQAFKLFMTVSPALTFDLNVLP